MQLTFSHQLELKRAETDPFTSIQRSSGQTYTFCVSFLPPTLSLGPVQSLPLQSHGECLSFERLLKPLRCPPGCSLEGSGVGVHALNLAVWDSPGSRHIRRKMSILHPALWLVTCRKNHCTMRRPESRRVRHWSSSPGTWLVAFSLWDRGELSTGADQLRHRESLAPSSWPQTRTFGLACCHQAWKNSLRGMPAPAPACQPGL